MNKINTTEKKYVSNMLIGAIPKSKSEQAWSITKLLSSFLWGGTKFVVKNTPAALGMAWEVKKELSDGIAQTIHQANIEKKKLDLEDKILDLDQSKKDIKNTKEL